MSRASISSRRWAAGGTRRNSRAKRRSRRPASCLRAFSAEVDAGSAQKMRPTNEARISHPKVGSKWVARAFRVPLNNGRGRRHDVAQRGGASVAQAQTVDLSRIIDSQKIGAFHITLVVICFIIVMADGYDIGAAAFAAPALIKQWHINPQMLGQMFSAGLFAGLFGPPILGWIADHFGRGMALVGGLVFFG